MGHVPWMTLAVMMSVTSAIQGFTARTTPFKPVTGSSGFLSNHFGVLYEKRYQVERLKAEILRGLNLTTEPQPPTKKPPNTVSRILNRLPVPRNRTRPASVPDAIVWAEPVGRSGSKKPKDDQLLFRVNNQKDKSAVINRVTLLLRLRFKQKSPKSKTKRKPKGKVKKKKKKKKKDGKKTKQDSSAPGKEPQSDQKPNKKRGSGNKSGKAGRKKKTSKRKTGRKKSRRRVKVLVQAMAAKSGKFKRVAAQRVTINKKFSWIKLPIPASLVARAAESPSQSLVLRVRCKRCSKGGVTIDSALPRRKARGGDSGTADRGDGPTVLNRYRPYLVICTADTPLSVTTQAPESPPRSARHVADEPCPVQPQRGHSCCATRMEVTFKDLGWDGWIMHPVGFSTVTCSACDAESDEHSQLLSERRLSQSRPVTLPRSDRPGFPGDSGADSRSDSSFTKQDQTELVESCQPLDPSPLTVMYSTDHSTLVRADIPGLVSDSCTCHTLLQ